MRAGASVPPPLQASRNTWFGGKSILRLRRPQTLGIPAALMWMGQARDSENSKARGPALGKKAAATQLATAPVADQGSFTGVIRGENYCKQCLSVS